MMSILHHLIWPGWYRGTLATVLRDAPFSAIYLLCYTRLKARAYNTRHIHVDHVAQAYVADDSTPGDRAGHHVLLETAALGLVAGALASVLTHPQVKKLSD